MLPHLQFIRFAEQSKSFPFVSWKLRKRKREISCEKELVGFLVLLWWVRGNQFLFVTAKFKVVMHKKARAKPDLDLIWLELI
jgi:hypothetical protein